MFPRQREAYDLFQIVGSGSTADVWAAKCLTNGQTLAVKVVDLEQCPIEIETLHQEVAFWSKCDHPNIVRYYGSFQKESVLYLLMEYMSAGSCYEVLRLIRPQGFDHEPVIASILSDVLHALAYLHENHQLHRDVKTGNILLSERGEVKIGDFGIAANLVEDGKRRKSRFTVVGTPAFMAPEVLSGQVGYSEKADIWSLGITSLELATGQAPWSDLYPLEVIAKVVREPPPQLPDDGKWTREFREFVGACLQRNPDKRGTAAALLKMPFFKKIAGRREIVDLVNQLPPAATRYAGIVGRDTEHRREARGHIVWDFGDPPAAAPPAAAPASHVATPSDAPTGTTVQRGRFTIQTGESPHPDVPRASDPADEIRKLKEQVGILTAENAALKARVAELEARLAKMAT